MTGALREYLRSEIDRRQRDRLAVEAAAQAEHDRMIFELAEQDELRKRRRRVHHPPRTCRECRRSFVPRRADASFCKAACKQRHFRRQRAAA